MFRKCLDFISNESGSVVIEYGLIIALLVIGIIGSVISMGGSLATFFENALAGLSAR